MTMCRLKANNASSNHDGFVLVVVIVVMLLATFLASQLIIEVRTEAKVVHNGRTQAAGRYQAEAGVQLALFRKFDTAQIPEQEEHEVFIDGYPYEIKLGPGRVRYSLTSEAGKIDLNNLNRPLMGLFLSYHGLDPDRIEVVLDSLQDWVDRDNLHRLSGAENDVYAGFALPYAPRNGAIAEVEEFFLVNGTAGVGKAFDPGGVFTVYNRSGRLNFNSLTPAMLDFVVEGDAEKKKAYRKALVAGNGHLGSGDAREILGTSRFRTLGPFLTYDKPSEPYYFIVSTWMNDYHADGEPADVVKTAPGTRVSVLVHMQGRKPRFLSWRVDHI